MAQTGEKRMTDKNFDGKSFQDLESRVKEILDKLNSDQVSLDEQVELGEEGSSILDEMEKRLSALKARVESISKDSEER